MWFSADQPEEASAAEVLRKFREAGPRFADARIPEADTRVEYWNTGSTLFEVLVPSHDAAIHALYVPEDLEQPFRAGWSWGGYILDYHVHFEPTTESAIQWVLAELREGPPRE